MATYDLAFHTRQDDVVVLQTFVETGIQVGDVVTIAGAAHGRNRTLKFYASLTKDELVKTNN